MISVASVSECDINLWDVSIRDEYESVQTADFVATTGAKIRSFVEGTQPTHLSMHAYHLKAFGGELVSLWDMRCDHYEGSGAHKHCRWPMHSTKKSYKHYPRDSYRPWRNRKAINQLQAMKTFDVQRDFSEYLESLFADNDRIVATHNRLSYLNPELDDDDIEFDDEYIYGTVEEVQAYCDLRGMHTDGWTVAELVGKSDPRGCVESPERFCGEELDYFDDGPDWFSPANGDDLERPVFRSDIY